MDRGSASESRLLSLIESSDEIIGFKQLVTGYLRSFAPFLKRSQAAACKPAKHSKSNPTGNAQVFRSLAKEFLPFLHKSLSLLPKRLSGLPKIPRESAVELLDVYRLCLDCLDVIAPELSGKPYSVQVQRIRFVHSLEHWELYEEAQAEGFLLLQNLKATYEGGSKGNSGKRKTTFVPLLNTENEDREAASIIVELVVTLVKFASKLKKKVDSEYWTVISMVNESDPWFKILDSESYMKFHRFLQSYLHIITLFLVGELKSFHVDLICEFSQCTFKEYKKSSAHDQTCKVALKICSLLFSQIDKMPCDPILDVLKHVLRFMASESKSRIEGKLEFLELLHYCANKSLSATMYLCDQLAEHLHELADALLERLEPLRKAFSPALGTVDIIIICYLML
ncbi:hypothetical protein M569_09327 [Genlisea aurea]|uniref:Separase n=1 Tax=Genlisea aurea TaxID=192259 RepID=S8CF30_9LAMI|nr:hypothetical protein M569_09327 [Genlisea aurea]